MVEITTDISMHRLRRATGYTVHVRPGKELTLHGVPLTGIIYIGRAARPDRRGPLRDHYTGTSSLRRSLGALLKEQCGLTAIPSGSGRAERDYINYRFTNEGETKLTEWINSNLEVRPLPLEHVGETKRATIYAEKPVLCLSRRNNPYAAKIAGLRRVCADEARGTRRDGQYRETPGATPAAR